MKGSMPDHRGADARPSPNFGERRDGKKVSILLLHYTGMPDGPGAEDWLCDPASEVSCHYIVHEDGRIVQMVREADRAWHAGAGQWAGETDVNSCSVGIEIVNPGHPGGLPEFPAVQIDAVIALSRGIVERHAIAPERVLAHSDVSPGRKLDPGEKFPWDVLARAGVGRFVTPSPIDGGPFLSQGEVGPPVEALQSMLALYGYGIEISGRYNERTRVVVEAFQRHFRPARVDGIADRSTVETLHNLLGGLLVS